MEIGKKSISVNYEIYSFRRVYENGTLVVSGGADGDGGETVVVRCRADNVHGAALSREVRLQPVEDARWEPALNVAPATAGGVAALVCRSIGATAAGDVRPELWYKDDRLLVLDPPSPGTPYHHHHSAPLGICIYVVVCRNMSRSYRIHFIFTGEASTLFYGL